MIPSRLLIGLGAELLLSSCSMLVLEDGAKGGSLATTGGVSGESMATTADGGAGGRNETSPGRGGTGGAGQGAAARGGNEGSGVGCDPDQRAAENWDSGYLLEIARAVPEERSISIQIILAYPTGLTATDPEACQATLAPSQNEIEALLRDRNANNVQSYSSCDLRTYNMVSADLKARYVRETLCWPWVQSVRSIQSYWMVVDRPWNLNSVGTQECPLQPGPTCPPHCGGVGAYPIDQARACFDDALLVACTVRQIEPFTSGGCAVESATGTLYSFPVNAPSQPAYDGWLPCTDGELAMHDQALKTACD